MLNFINKLDICSYIKMIVDLSAKLLNDMIDARMFTLISTIMIEQV